MNIVMVTKDRPTLFEQSIRSLYNHTGNGFRLVVVDDCSEDRSMLWRLRATYGFEVICNSEPTPLGGSKNLALLTLDDGLVYLTDNDVYFRPGWLRKLLIAWSFRPPEVKLLGGGCHKWLGTNRVAKNPAYAVEYHYKDAVSGWSWLMERQTWIDYGPLDSNALGSGQSEDWAFCQRIKAAGFEVASIWPEVVVHCGRTNTEGQPAIGSETIGDVPGVIVQ